MLNKDYINFFSTKTIPLAVWLVFIFAFCSTAAMAQNKIPADTAKKSQPKKNIISARDSAALLADTSGKNMDTTALNVDTLNIPISKSALTAQVKYKAKDSIIYDIETKKVYLYGNAHIDYADLTLDAAFITIDWNTNEISAEGMPDSTGKIAGTPVFKEGEQNFKSKKLTYNFKTKRGRINELISKEGDEGYIHGGIVKTVRRDDGKDIIYAKNAKYTTCDLDDPHFYIQTNKLKLIPKEKVITGPAMIYIEKVPIPLVLPFGFFPANSRKSSGIIIPAIGNAGTRGFSIRNGGFYYGGSDYFDAALIGDLYTGGSYRTELQTNYAKRYRFDGGVTLGYSRLDNYQPKETKNFEIQESYFVQWHHNQNPKAHPGSTFNASVNASGGQYLRENAFNANAITQDNMESSISYGRQFRILGAPINLTTALNHSQILSKGQMDFTLPNVNLSMSRINPFKPKEALKKRWYHDIGVGYNLNVQNLLSTSDSTLRQDLNWKNFTNGAHQNIPVSTSFNIFNYFNFSPSLNYDGFFYTRRDILKYNQEKGYTDTTTENGFFQAHTWNASASLSTRIFGMFPINRGKLVALRHQLTPTLIMVYSPDFGEAKYGYYRNVQVEPLGRRNLYSVYAESSRAAGLPSFGRQGSLSFSLQNNLELKVRSDKDTAQETKKIKIFENLQFDGGYNFLADSLRLAPFGISASTLLFDKIRINGNTSLDPYKIDSTGNVMRHIDEFVWKDGHSIGRVSSANLTFSTDLNAKAREDASRIATYHNPYIGYYYRQPYANFNIPWNLGLSYNLYYSKPFYESSVTQTAAINGELNITPKWRVTADIRYDIREKNIAMSEFNIYRDLHCWEMSFQWIPFGQFRRYFFNIHIKASSLRDLKVEKRNDNY